jgi:hypothetical protein
MTIRLALVLIFDETPRCRTDKSAIDVGDCLDRGVVIACHAACRDVWDAGSGGDRYPAT